MIIRNVLLTRNRGLYGRGLDGPQLMRSALGDNATLSRRRSD
jgi:hypothetical protein